MKKFKRSFALFCSVLLIFTLVEPLTMMASASSASSITYWAHVQNYGWMSPKNHSTQVPSENDYAGTTAEGLQLECLQIQLNSAISGAVYVQSHVQDIGWTDATRSECGRAQRTGTEGRGLRMEAIRIWLDGAIANHYSIAYRTHVQNIGWQGWVRDGATAGTEGQSLRIEAIQIYLVEKTPPSITYWAHVQNYGWMPPKNHGTQVPSDNDYAGTTGEGLQLECLQILLNGSVSGTVYAQSHIQDIGWTGATGSGCGIAQRTGTEGQSRRMEAIRLWLDGEVANRYSIEYRTHVQNIGWQNWVRDGGVAGTEGQSLRIEAIQIRLVEKSSGTINNATPTNASNNSALRSPIKGQLTRSSNLTTNGQYCDYKAASGTAIYAPADGTVAFRQSYAVNYGKLCSYGNSIFFTSNDGKTTVLCAHLSSFNGVNLTYTSSLSYPCSSKDYTTKTTVLATRTVKQGDLLGYSGATGNASAAHLHMEVKQNGTAVSPLSALATW